MAVVYDNNALRSSDSSGSLDRVPGVPIFCPMQAAPIQAVGTDRVVSRGAARIVYAAAAIEGWEVRDYRRTAIRLQGDRFVVARVDPWGLRGRRYVLEPWPEGEGDDAVHEICYDEDLVARRDEAIRMAIRQHRRLPLVCLARPFAGFLWCASRRRLHLRYGLHPRRAAEASLWIEYALLVLCGGLSSIALMGTISGGAPVLPVKPLLAVSLVLGLDGLARGNALLEGTMDPPGFLEWLFRKTPPPS